MTDEENTVQEDVEALKRRKLRAETRQLEREVVLNERRHFLEWLNLDQPDLHRRLP